MKKIHLLFLLIGFISAQEERDVFKGKALYDMCMGAVNMSDDPDSFTNKKLQNALECFATYRTFINTLAAVETTFYIAEMEARMGGEFDDENKNKLGSAHLYSQIYKCEWLTDVSAEDWAYGITDYIRDNPEFRTKLYTEAIWTFAQTKCGITPFNP